MSDLGDIDFVDNSVDEFITNNSELFNTKKDKNIRYKTKDVSAFPTYSNASIENIGDTVRITLVNNTQLIIKISSIDTITKVNENGKDIIEIVSYNQNQRSGGAKVKRTKLESRTVDELKALCAKKKIKTTGLRKAQMISLLRK